MTDKDSIPVQLYTIASAFTTSLYSNFMELIHNSTLCVVLSNVAIIIIIVSFTDLPKLKISHKQTP